MPGLSEELTLTRNSESTLTAGLLLQSAPRLETRDRIRLAQASARSRKTFPGANLEFPLSSAREKLLEMEDRRKRRPRCEPSLSSVSIAAGYRRRLFLADVQVSKNEAAGPVKLYEIPCEYPDEPLRQKLGRSRSLEKESEAIGGGLLADQRAARGTRNAHRERERRATAIEKFLKATPVSPPSQRLLAIEICGYAGVKSRMSR